ncbi:GDYXXLXY domain-containing protein [Lacimonas salitolerans]|uniref:GDYXXLXY domain-containing protein n=1 Tax=Lacimonas salitolerans TaxID=1323750 RepID=A0ABW4EGC2_9RHOB
MTLRLSRRLILPAALIAALVQTALAGKMIVDRAALLRDGAEVVLATGFVDPRDLFRGHYVVLNLTISQLPKDSVAVSGSPILGNPVWVELTAAPDSDFWQPARLHAALPDMAQAPVLRGTLVGDYGDIYSIQFPIDRFFAPKLRAQELEDLRAESRLGVILALAPDGEAAIKGITVDGARLYEEPLY